MSLSTTISANFKTLQSAAGVDIVYARGDRTVSLRAVPGDTSFVQQTGEGYMETVESRDFIFPAADLNLGGSPVLPDRGDMITETVNGVEQSYPVTSGGASRYFRYADPYRTILRVHTKLT